MCRNPSVLNQTKNGFLFRCKKCGIYHLTFGHLYLELSQEELEHFSAFLDQIKASYWEEYYRNFTIKRKIPIPTLQRNLHIMLNRAELEELKGLLALDSSDEVSQIGVENVDYTIILN